MEKRVKKFIPCIWLKNGRAVKSREDGTRAAEDADDLARDYEKQLADAVIVADISPDDRDRAETIRVIRTICTAVMIPVIGIGNTESVEDAKELIYAGCQIAVLDFDADGAELCEAAAEKLGRERIGAFCSDPEKILANRERIRSYAPCLFIPGRDLLDAAAKADVPVVLGTGREEAEDLLDLLLCESVTALTGEGMNEEAGKIRAFKKACLERDIPVDTRQAVFAWSDLKKDSDGLVPVVVQEAYTDKVLMVAYMDENAYNKTIATGKMTYFSRSRQREWIKGETSGHFQYVRSLTCDCDLDTILARVDQIGAACHTGHHSCFFNTDIVLNRLEKHNPRTILETDYETILDRKNHPKKGSYTNSLLERGLDGTLAKLMEENGELLVAAKNGVKADTVDEIADCLYHLMVVMAEEGITWKDVTEELSKRAKDETVSGEDV